MSLCTIFCTRYCTGYCTKNCTGFCTTICKMTCRTNCTSGLIYICAISHFCNSFLQPNLHRCHFFCTTICTRYCTEFCKWFCTPFCTVSAPVAGSFLQSVSAYGILFPLRPGAITSRHSRAACPLFSTTPLLPYPFACSRLGQTTAGFY